MLLGGIGQINMLLEGNWADKHAVSGKWVAKYAGRGNWAAKHVRGELGR